MIGEYLGNLRRVRLEGISSLGVRVIQPQRMDRQCGRIICHKDQVEIVPALGYHDSSHPRIGGWPREGKVNVGRNLPAPTSG